MRWCEVGRAQWARVTSHGEVFGEQERSACWEGERILAVSQKYHPKNPLTSPYIVTYIVAKIAFY